MPHEEIMDAIEQYSQAYDQLQALQEAEPLLQIGDQKTGVIGEYFGLIHAIQVYGDDNVLLGPPGQHAWDIQVHEPNNLTIQVKTVSDFSGYRRISPIHAGWDHLYVIYLNRNFWPTGFWIFEDNVIMGGRQTLANQTCPNPVNGNAGGSAMFADAPNQIADLLASIHAFGE